MSYKEINKDKNTLSNLLKDSHTMSYYHTKRADYINDPVFHTKNNVHGVFYDVGGNSASSFQFFATDSVKHFIRGALYFDVTPNIDSLKPVNLFLQKDVVHLVNTLKWK
jgi:gliding motility-associated lipoprotein GldD